MQELVLRAMEAELRRQLAWRRKALAAKSSVRDVLLVLRPGRPFTMLDQGVAAAVPDTEGVTGAPALLQGGAEPPPARKSLRPCPAPSDSAWMASRAGPAMSPCRRWRPPSLSSTCPGRGSSS